MTENLDAMRAIGYIPIDDREMFKSVLSATLVKHERHQRAFDWALFAEVTTLTQVPAPYDLGPEMKVFPCPKG